MKHNLPPDLADNPVVWIRGMETIYYNSDEKKNSILINFQVDDRSFKPYYTISEIIEIMKIKYNQKNKYMKEIILSFDKLMNSWKKMDMSSDSVIYSIIRRISRESSATSKLIDQLAEKIVEMVNEIFVNEGKNLIIVLNATEWVDRPSLRVLNRILKLLPSSRIKLVLGFTGNIPSKYEVNNPFDMLESIFVARSRIFKRLLVEQKPLITGEETEQCDFSDFCYVGTENGLMSDAAVALITQNYENAFLACEKFLNIQNGESEEIFRIMGLVHANLSLYEASYSAFQEALKHEETGPKRAHIECLAALLAVKRFYNLDVAHSHYESALKFVDESDTLNKLEKGWILNGMSFMDTVASSKLEGEEKNKVLEAVLERELKALALIKMEKDSGSLYLKYNLLSNITFLLEISKDYRSALEFWKTAFTKLIGDDHGYLYRTGMLSWKAGKIDDGLNYLKKAFQTALSQKDRLDSERILYALGYVNLDVGNYEESIRNFGEGLKISLILRESEQIEEHIQGFLYASYMEGKMEENLVTLQDICSNFEDVLPNELLELLKKDTVLSSKIIVEKKLRHPKTKLSSYHPSVDLESVPEIDMNEYLIRNNKENDAISKIMIRS